MGRAKGKEIQRSGKKIKIKVLVHNLGGYAKVVHVIQMRISTEP
jgi:hypothetical protein